jgi:hypothetical protein
MFIASFRKNSGIISPSLAILQSFCWDKLSSYLNKEVTVRFGKLKMQLWDSMC